MRLPSPRCQLEERVLAALARAGQSPRRENDPDNKLYLDFMIGEPPHEVYVEVKRYHTPRSCDQLARADNVILIQGERAVALFEELLK